MAKVDTRKHLTESTVRKARLQFLLVSMCCVDLSALTILQGFQRLIHFNLTIINI